MRGADQIFGNQSLRAYHGIVLAILKRAGLRHFRHQHYECDICEGILELNSRVHVRRKANMPFPHTKKTAKNIILGRNKSGAGDGNRTRLISLEG